MSKEQNIKRGGLAEKMAGFTPLPPEAVWEGVSSKVQGGKRGRKLFILLAVAAGIALALTVGLTFLNVNQVDEYTESYTVQEKNSQEPDNEVYAIKEKGVGYNEKEASETVIVPQEEKTPSVSKKAIIARENPTKKVSKLEKKVILALKEEIKEASVSGDEAFTEDLRIAKVEDDETRHVSDNAIDSVQTEALVAPILKINEDSLLMILHPDKTEEFEDLSKDKGTKSKWQLGASVSPQISYRDVASMDMYQNNAANNSESAKMTYAGGMQVSYKQSKRLTIESGVYYNRMGVNIGEYSNFRSGWFSNKEYADAGPENVVSVSNSMGTIVTASNSIFVNNYSSVSVVSDYHTLQPEDMQMNNSTVNSFTQSLDYLEFPLNLRYEIYDNSFKVHLLGGVSTNVLVNNSISAITEDSKTNIGQVQDIRSVNYSGNAGIGFVYDFPGNFSLSVEPRFRYYLNSVNMSNLPATRPYTFGLYTGVNYSF